MGWGEVRTPTKTSNYLCWGSLSLPKSYTRNLNDDPGASDEPVDTDSGKDTSIRDANKLKSFLTYKHLLEIHHIQKGHQIDLFNLLVNGVLKHFRYTLTHGKELGELWQTVETLIAKTTDISYNLPQKKKEVNAALLIFNDAFSELFKTDSPEYILKHAIPILNQFNHNLEIKLAYWQAKPDSDYQAIENNHVHIDLTYAGKKITEPHLFLNEARLSAIAISIYLGAYSD